MKLAYGVILIALGLPAGAMAEESVQPYIDQIKSEIEPTTPTAAPAVSGESGTGSVSPYIDSIRGKVKSQPNSEGYAESIKENEIEPPPPTAPSPEQSYTDGEKQLLGPVEQTSAIDAFNQGHSQLQQKRVGQITGAFGFDYGASVNRVITASASILGRDFNSVYGANYAPDVTLFYEWQPFHSETWGDLGLILNAGISYFTGMGQFAFQLTNPINDTLFPITSQTAFTFYEVPVSAGLQYKFNLAKYIRPFVSIDPGLIGYLEARNDGINGSGGYSYCLHYTAGASLLLDWISPHSSWNLYAEQGIKHFYLTAEYIQIFTLGGDVSFNENGVFAGLTFEY